MPIQTLQPLTHQILSNPESLRTYLSGDRHIQHLQQVAAYPSRKHKPVISNIFEAFWVTIKTVIAVSTGIFALSVSAFIICNKNLQLQLDFLAIKLISKNFSKLLGYKRYGKDFLVSTINLPQVKDKKVYSSSLARSSFTDPLMQQRLVFTNGINGPKLKRGVCRGSTAYFNYLVLRTQHLFEDRRSQLIAIAQLFQSGSPAEASLLQLFASAEYYLMNLESRVALAHIEEHTRPIIDLRYENLMQRVQELNAGVYSITLFDKRQTQTRGHAISFIKVDEESAYIKDDNRGLIELKGNVAEKLLNYIGKTGPFFHEGSCLLLINEQRYNPSFFPNVSERPLYHQVVLDWLSNAQLTDISTDWPSISQRV